MDTIDIFSVLVIFWMLLGAIYARALWEHQQDERQQVRDLLAQLDRDLDDIRQQKGPYDDTHTR